MPVGECNLALGSWVRDGLIPSSLCTVHLHSESRTVKSETAQPTQRAGERLAYSMYPHHCVGLACTHINTQKVITIFFK